MTATGVEEDVRSDGPIPAAAPSRLRTGRYWRELVFGRLLPAVFFSLFLVRYLLTLWESAQHVHRPFDYLFVLQQLLALAYFTMLVVLYSTRLPARGTDHRFAVVFIAFTGTFSAMAASFLPGGGRHDWLVIPADILATLGLAYAVWGLAYLRRSFSIVPEARRLVTGGPYAFSRHPVYLGEIVTAIGINLATAGWPSALAVLYFVVCELLRMRWEEGVLARAFPDEYPAYASECPATRPTRSRP